MSGRGIPKSKRIEKTIYLVDVMPTVLSLLGIPKPSSLDGLDICPLWRDSDPQLAERYIFAKASKDTALPDERSIRHDIKRAVRHGRFKLYYDRLSEKAQLYDLQCDPHEEAYVASEHAVLVDSILLRFKEFMSVDVPVPSVAPLSLEEIQRRRSLGYIM